MRAGDKLSPFDERQAHLDYYGHICPEKADPDFTNWCINELGIAWAFIVARGLKEEFEDETIKSP